ncbi:HNH endonuclease [Vibrio brasiliensis]|uniref:HNH endonuclease n=1 Tax=Vibrio brasiliensis TaxID=170652 RepID=UPI001EFE78AA|nr:HNH endonuclease [Vibrio brasiliensis]MCG9750664.1 HNH endonuclease [Vibrio brasiliensis]
MNSADISREHIIPLSLGGMDGFEIPVGKEINKKVGSKIDGKVSNDPFIALDRKNAQVKGHSGKLSQPVWKNVRVGDEKQPLQIRFNAPGDTEHWCPKTKAVVNPASLAGKNAEIHLKVDVISPLLFVAKVALAAGYFVYGDTFKNNADIASLQDLVNIESKNQDRVLSSSRLHFIDRFQHEDKDLGDYLLFKEIGELKSCSTVTLMQHQDGIVVAVSILGKFLGAVDVDAIMDKFPNEGSHRQGHVVFLDRENGIKTMSFYDVICIVGDKYGLQPHNC